MTDWLRIGDDEIAQYGEHSWVFRFPNGTYRLTVSEDEQDDILVQLLDKKEYWPVNRKEKSGSVFKLSGMADWVPEILETVCWFELIISPKPKITYWGDRIIYRTDLAT